jgi:hypothetical protein
MKIADALDRAVDARCGPDSTFDQLEEMAAAIMREVLAQYARTSNSVTEPDGES